VVILSEFPNGFPLKLQMMPVPPLSAHVLSSDYSTIWRLLPIMFLPLCGKIHE
jgi:hypothetical protein